MKKPYSLGGILDEELMEELRYRLSVGYNIPGSTIHPGKNEKGEKKVTIELWCK